MSLVFGANTSDRVSYTVGASTQNLASWTVWAWVYPTTLSTRGIFFQGIAAADGYRVFTMRSTGQMDVAADFSTSEAQARSTNNAGNTITINKWWFVAAIIDASKIPHLYIGDQTTPVFETTYATQTTGVGTADNDGGGVGYVGNRDDATLAFQGRIAFCAYENTILTLSELNDRRLCATVALTAKMFYNLGAGGAGNQIDQSGNGNTGTVTGAVLGIHVALPRLSSMAASF